MQPPRIGNYPQSYAVSLRRSLRGLTAWGCVSTFYLLLELRGSGDGLLFRMWNLKREAGLLDGMGWDGMGWDGMGARSGWDNGVNVSA
jgi:hypothetical protein